MCNGEISSCVKDNPFLFASRYVDVHTNNLQWNVLSLVVSSLVGSFDTQHEFRTRAVREEKRNC